MVDFLHADPARKRNLGPQFMNIEQLKSLPANDFSSDMFHGSDLDRQEDVGIGPEHRDITVGELTRHHPYYTANGAEGAGYDWSRLHREVADHGLTTPLHIGSAEPYGATTGEDRLLNGHHRAILAQEHGHMFVPFTDNPQHDHGAMEYRDSRQYQRPRRTWEPMIQEHEDEAERATWGQTPVVHQDQGQLFAHPKFTDRRSRG
jgi:hypothetical protein